jgi:hypothetical protein
MDMSPGRPGEQKQRLVTFVVLLGVLVAIFALLAAPGLWLLDTVVSSIFGTVKVAATAPIASRVSLAVAAIPLTLLIAEWRGFFPGLPQWVTTRMNSLQELRYWGVVVGLAPGIVVMAVAATIARTLFT